MASSRMRAPSLWLQYEYKEPGDILMQDVLVPKSGLATCTYYCCLNWNCGQEGGGYCGIQDHPKGRAFIFSIWDSKKAKGVPITASFKGPGTWTENFGGEGTGLKSMNFELGWKEDQWYTMVMRRWDGPNNTTCFGCWVHDQTAEKWTHLTTMDYPVPDVSFTGTTVSFLEDWAFTSEKYRCGRFRNGFKRTKDSTWIPFRKTTFQVNTEDTATRNFDAVCLEPHEGICIIAGADTKPSIGTRCSFDQQHHCPVPEKTSVKLAQAFVSGRGLKWELADSSRCVPQFRYRVTTNGKEVACGFGEDVREVDLGVGVQEKSGKYLLEIEDLLGNVVRECCYAQQV